VLDSIRAAATLVEASVESRAAVVGISQGGHAALWSGELQPGHAPEIALLGIVAASPPMDLRSVQDAVLGGPSPSVSPGAGGGDGAADPRAASWLETLLVVAAWHELLGAPIDGLLTDEGRNIVAALARECPWTMDGPHAYPFQTDPRSIPAWQELLEANSPGHAPSRAPIFILAATADEQVAPSTIPVGIDRLRAVGSTVELRWVDGGHTSTVTEPAAMALVLDWLRDRFRR
jgi:pimeloyl-ACP methyl ester carboxylesterase